MKKSTLNFVVLLGMILLASCGVLIRLTETESIGKDAVKNSVCENDYSKTTHRPNDQDFMVYSPINHQPKGH